MSADGVLQSPKATFTLLRFHFHSFLQKGTLPIHIAPFSKENAMKTVSVHIAPAKTQS